MKLRLFRRRYYTEEVRTRLEVLLSKNIRDFTSDDVLELRKIADLIEREDFRSGRDDLLDYASMLRIFTYMLEAYIIKKKIESSQTSGIGNTQINT